MTSNKVKMTPKIRAHRMLKRKDRYIDFEHGDVPDYITPKTYHVGVYENELGSAENAILVTDEGIELLGDNGYKVSFADMVDVKTPKVDKLSVYHLEIYTVHSDKAIILPVLGAKERTRDSFEFLTFLMRCMGDQKAG